MHPQTPQWVGLAPCWTIAAGAGDASRRCGERSDVRQMTHLPLEARPELIIATDGKA